MSNLKQIVWCNVGISVKNSCMDGTSPRTAHLVGVCGAGMKALAELLLDRHWSLSGSDLLPANESLQKLICRGLNFHQGHHEANVPDSAECLIYSPAIPSQNSERMTAQNRQIPQFSYGKMVGQLMGQSVGVCVAGTHGKSTTTAMTSRILQAAGRISGAVVGAELCDTGRNGWSGPDDLFVAESCEFQQSFLEFQPRYSAILSVEADHFDCYPDAVSLESAFRDFANRTTDDGMLLFNGDCPVSNLVAKSSLTKAKRVSFGSHSTADWSADHVLQTNQGSRFTLKYHGNPVGEIDLLLHGQHNVMNALAAASLCCEIGLSFEVIRETLAKFRGIRRRFEFVGEWNGATLIDDYAHHPTAVKITLETLRNLYESRRIRCIFQPHQVLRTTSLMEEFAASFSAVDEVLIAPIFAARESVTDQPLEVARKLARRIAANGVAANSFSSLDQIVSTLEDSCRSTDVIVTMGAGDIDRIHHELIRRVQ